MNTNAARYQNLSINQTKLSGQCGRLKCCLNYELDTYLDALQQFPDNCDSIEIARGRAYLVKKDIFRNLMWYTLPDSNKQYPLTLERVKKIKSLNQQGIKPDELEPVEVQSKKPVDIEPTYADVVGQISLQSLEKTSRKRRDNERGQQGNRQGGNDNRGNGPRNNPNDQRGQQPGNDQRGQQGNNPNRQQQRPPQNRGNNNQPQQNRGNNNQPPQRGQGNNEPQQNQNNPNQQRGNRPQNRPPQRPTQNRGGQQQRPEGGDDTK